MNKAWWRIERVVSKPRRPQSNPERSYRTVIEHSFYAWAGLDIIVCMFEVVPGCVAEAFAALDEANRHARAAEVAAVVAVAKAAELYEVDQEAVFEGMERVIFPGHAGTPGVGEFLAAEIAGILGISTGSALQRIADVLDVRFRFPRLWEAFLGGELRWWQVVDVTNRAAMLGVRAVEWLDRQLAWAMKVWSWQQILKHIDRWIVEADPAVAAERAEAERRRRDVEVSGITDGHCTIWGIVDAADGVAFDHALTAVARTLPAEEGDLRQRRAAAVGVLARRVSGQDALPAATVVVHVNATDPALGLVEPTDGAGGIAGSSPVASGAAVVERWGALLTARIPEFLAGSRVTVRPVMDPWAISPETPHRPSVSLRTAVETLMPHDVFPYGATPSRSCDLDHTIPYADDGGPGQTRWGNLGPLSRFTHRVKTHGGWHLTQPEPGIFHWSSPAGYQYLVTAQGTIRIASPPPRPREPEPPPDWWEEPPPPEAERSLETEAWAAAAWVLAT